jgi:hypothetical protein
VAKGGFGPNSIMKKARWLVVVLGDWTGTEDEDFEVILKAQKKWIKVVNGPKKGSNCGDLSGLKALLK